MHSLSFSAFISLLLLFEFSFQIAYSLPVNTQPAGNPIAQPSPRRPTRRVTLSALDTIVHPSPQQGETRWASEDIIIPTSPLRAQTQMYNQPAGNALAGPSSGPYPQTHMYNLPAGNAIVRSSSANAQTHMYNQPAGNAIVRPASANPEMHRGPQRTWTSHNLPGPRRVTMDSYDTLIHPSPPPPGQTRWAQHDTIVPPSPLQGQANPAPPQPWQRLSTGIRRQPLYSAQNQPLLPQNYLGNYQNSGHASGSQSHPVSPMAPGGGNQRPSQSKTKPSTIAKIFSAFKKKKDKQ